MNQQNTDVAYNVQPKIEYKTLFNKHVGQLDDEVGGYLNSGWMPHGPQYHVEGCFYQTVIKVPQQAFQRLT